MTAYHKVMAVRANLIDVYMSFMAAETLASRALWSAVSLATAACREMSSDCRAAVAAMEEMRVLIADMRLLIS